MGLERHLFRQQGIGYEKSNDSHSCEFGCHVILAMTASASTFVNIDRPPEAEGPTQVRVGIFVVDVDDIQTDGQSFTANVVFRLRWSDPRLAHDGPSRIARPLDEV